MQNPFRHEDHAQRPDHDDRMSQGGQPQRPEEYRTWGGGDGGRSAEAFRHYGHEPGYGQNRDPSAAGAGWGYGQNQQSQYGQGMSTPYTGDRGAPWRQGAQAYGGPQHGPGHSSQGYGSPAYGASQGYGSPSYGAPNTGGQYGGQAFGPGMSHGYAPGSQIWEGSGRGMGGQSHEHHDFEPDYLHWRQQQLSAFDKDYSDWRNERREKFSSDFDSWRQSRTRTQAENPIVGDVSDGGTDNAAEARKR